MHLYLYFVERKTAWWPVEGTTQRVSDIAIFPEQLREIDGKLLLLKYQWNDKGMPQITCAKSCVIVANKFYLYLHQTVHKTSTQMYLFFMSRVPLYNVIADCTQSSSVSLSSALSLVISLESIDFNLKLLRRLWSHAAEWEGCKKYPPQEQSQLASVAAQMSEGTEVSKHSSLRKHSLLWSRRLRECRNIVK